MSSKLREEMNQVVAWIKSTVENTGAKGVVLGLSGGVDSAVVGALTVEALGEKVLPVTMPIQGTKAHMDQGAADMFAYLHKVPFTITINPEAFNASLNMFQWVDSVAKRIRLGNTAARMRMIHLYNLAHGKNYLVIGTENKTEMVLGYCTKYGDGASDLEPIKGFFKTEVIEMAEVLGLPESVTGREPSAELWEGQTDEKELGAKYVTEIDPYLKWYNDGRIKPSEEHNCPIEDELRNSLFNRIMKNAHKSASIPMFERTQ